MGGKGGFSDRGGLVGGNEGREQDPAVALEAVGRAHFVRIRRAVVGGQQRQLPRLSRWRWRRGWGWTARM